MNQEKLLATLTLLTAYGACVATIYLVSFWSTFGVNIMQFIGLTDILKLAIYPILLGAGFLGLWLLHLTTMSLMIAVRFAGEDDEASDSLSPPDSWVDWLVSKATPAVFTALFFILFSIVLGVSGYTLVWVSGSIAVGLILGILIEVVPIIKLLIARNSFRRILLYLVLIVPLFSFGMGKAGAHDILVGVGIKRISTKIIKAYNSDEFIQRELLSRDETLKFIGLAGDYFIFIREDNSAIYLLKYEDFYFIELWR